jgi:hypothetical protein
MQRKTPSASAPQARGETEDEELPCTPGRQECQEKVSGQQEVSAERLAVLEGEQDAQPVLLRVPPGEQDVRPVLKVPPGEQQATSPTRDVTCRARRVSSPARLATSPAGEREVAEGEGGDAE